MIIVKSYDPSKYLSEEVTGQFFFADSPLKRRTVEDVVYSRIQQIKMTCWVKKPPTSTTKMVVVWVRNPLLRGRYSFFAIFDTLSFFAQFAPFILLNQLEFIVRVSVAKCPCKDAIYKLLVGSTTVIQCMILYVFEISMYLVLSTKFYEQTYAWQTFE